MGRTLERPFRAPETPIFEFHCSIRLELVQWPHSFRIPSFRACCFFLIGAWGDGNYLKSLAHLAAYCLLEAALLFSVYFAIQNAWRKRGRLFSPIHNKANYALINRIKAMFFHAISAFFIYLFFTVKWNALNFCWFKYRELFSLYRKGEKGK